MSRGVLAVIFSIFSILFMAPTVLAKDAGSAELKKKKVARTSLAAKHKSVSKLAKKRRSSSSSLHAKVRSPATKKTARKLAARSASKSVVASGASATLASSAVSDALPPLALQSNAALVYDQTSAEVLYAKNAKETLPIASITKLMTALVVVESRQNMKETLTVTKADIDTIKRTYSRLPIGSRMSRGNMLHIALMSSENRAASALGRHYPGGMRAFVKAMNKKAKQLGMTDTHYVEPTGLSSDNVSSARDLVKLVVAAHKHPVIREYSTHRKYAVKTGGPVLQYKNSNRLISNPDWDIELQKTGYISEAGRCLVMQSQIDGRSIIMVFLGSKGRVARATDVGNARSWIEAIDRPEIMSASVDVQG